MQERTRERTPLQWAATQNNLGAVLRTLAVHEGNIARLEEAAQAYRAALEVCTQERAPLQWEATHGNLERTVRFLKEQGVVNAG